MRESTVLYASVRHVGVPGSEESMQGEAKRLIPMLAKWLAGQPIKGSHFELRVSSTEANARFGKGASELDLILDSMNFDFSDGGPVE